MQHHLGDLRGRVARAVARQVPRRVVDDVVQEVLVGAWRSGTTAWPWVREIVRRQASNELRRAHHRRERLHPAEDLERVPSGAWGPGERVACLERLQLLRRVLAAVPVSRRRVFVLHELCGQEMTDVAAELSIPLSTAWSRHRLAWADVRGAARRHRARLGSL